MSLSHCHQGLSCCGGIDQTRSPKSLLKRKVFWQSKNSRLVTRYGVSPSSWRCTSDEVAKIPIRAKHFLTVAQYRAVACSESVARTSCVQKHAQGSHLSKTVTPTCISCQDTHKIGRNVLPEDISPILSSHVYAQEGRLANTRSPSIGPFSR